MRRLVIAAIAPLVLCTASTAFACGGGFALSVGHHFVGLQVGSPCAAAVASVAPNVVLPALPQMVPAQVKVANAPWPPAPPPPPTASTRAQRKPDDEPARIGLKYAPGVVAALGTTTPSVGFAHSLGVEVRATNWLTIRSDLELRPTAGSWDMVGVKVAAPWRVFSPFVSVSFTGSTDAAHPNFFSFGLMAAGGFDLKFGKHFFLTAEVRYRVAPTPCCREQPQLIGLAGAGVAFF